MPCTDGGVPYDTAPEHNTEAMLCAIMRAADLAGFTDELLARADWQEAGVSGASFMSWLESHRKADQRRRWVEHEKVWREKQRQEALAKLTDEERKALGL